MNRRHAVSTVLLVLTTLTSLLLRAQDSSAVLPPELTIEGGSIEFLNRERVVTYRDHVHLLYKGVDMFADEVRLNVDSLDIEATGHVKFQRGADVLNCEHLQGNLKSREYQMDAFTGQFGKWLFNAGGATRTSAGVLLARDVSLTTCETWWLRASSVEHHPDGTFKAKNVTWSTNGVPLMYLPYVSGNTNDDNAEWTMRMGHKSDWGVYLSVGRKWKVNDHFTTKIFGDWRSSRGFALGNESQLYGQGYLTDLYLYGMVDSDPLTDSTVNGTDYNNRFETEENRYRIRLFQKYDVADDITFRGNLDLISDNDLLLEFYGDDFQLDRAPATWGTLAWQTERADLTLYYKPQINEFQTTVERLPELRLDLPRQPLGDTGLAYQGETSAAILRTNWRHYDLPRNDMQTLDNYSTFRFDTLHFLYYPVELAWLNVVPRAGLRYTHYEDSSQTQLFDDELASNFDADDDRSQITDTGMLTNYDDLGGTIDRMAYELGLELSTKFYRNWADYRSERFQIDGLRHVVQPYANYTYIDNPSDSHTNLYYFDETDRIARANFVRVGVKQRFQTRRHQQVYTFLRVDTFADFYVEPEESQPHEGEAGLVADYNPTENFGLYLASLVNYDTGAINIFDAGITFGNGENWSARLGYLFRNDYQERYNYSMGSDLTRIGPANVLTRLYEQTNNVQLVLTYDVSSKTRLQTKHLFDLEAGEWAQQSYRISHEFQCWVTALELETNGDDFQLMLQLVLKGVGGFHAGS